jgi:hypothetical protein
MAPPGIFAVLIADTIRISTELLASKTPRRSSVQNMTLIDHHINELKRSGIDVDLARECGVDSVIDLDQAKRFLNLKELPPPPYLAYPYYCISDDRKIVSYSLKPDSPTDPRAKYIERAGEPHHLYVPRTISVEALTDSTKPLIITEGQKKTLCAVSHGYLAVGIAGVNSWRTKYEGDDKTKTLREFDALSLKGRTIYIAFDSDVIENRGILTAETQLAEFLASKGAEVLCVRIPGQRK